jgi:hypothetical protein
MEYSKHAEQRMAERRISRDDVEAALSHRTGTPKPGDIGRVVVFGYAPGRRILKVVLTSDEQVVVSVMESADGRGASR